MRNDRQETRPHHEPADEGSTSPLREVPHDERRFFESFYKATVKGKPVDWMTIGAISEPESRFHYNVTENSIIRALAGVSALPRGAVINVWRMLQQRAAPSLLDIGSGTGHWIDFFRKTYFVRNVVGIEITQQMAGFLREKYAHCHEIEILQADCAEPYFPDNLAGRRFDYISAIGVMFHIVDDIRWERALANLAGLLGPEGLMLVGGEFGTETKNVQYHKSDDFNTWKEFDNAGTTPGEIRVNKRVRSLDEWHRACNNCGLSIKDVVRSDRDARIITPENDIMLLAHN